MQSAAAFPQVNFYTNTELEKEYQALVQTYENRYTKIKPFSKVQFNQIDLLEERIGKLYGQLARTKSAITKKRLTNSIRVLTRQLNTRVTKIERSKGITASAT